jgi:hypothetical protein
MPIIRSSRLYRWLQHVTHDTLFKSGWVVLCVAVGYASGLKGVALVGFSLPLPFSTDFEKHSNIKFHDNPSSGCPVVWTNGQTDMTELMVAFRKCANAPKKCSKTAVLWDVCRRNRGICCFHCTNNTHDRGSTYTCTRKHSITSQVTVILVATTVKTWNPVSGACFFNYSTTHSHGKFT